MTNARLWMTRARALGVAGLTLGALATLARTANADDRLALQAPAPEPPPPVVAPPPPPAPAPPPPLPRVEPLPDEELPPPAPPAAPEAPPATPAATPTPEPTSDADAAALAALVGDLSGGGDSSLDPDEVTFSLYGFADFSYLTQIGKKTALAGQQPTFMVGNFNVYFSTEFERRWRSLAEVRFLYAPNGAWLTDDPFATSSSPRGNTSFLDGSDLNHPMRWGGIAIQRIWLEYQFDSYLTLRAGQWLTPYGIWNVDHGSPTIIGVYKPYIINQDWFPERQTGIEAYGSVYLGDTQLGYHLTLSNGRGPIDAYRDLDNNKGLGARLYVKNDALLGTFTLGLSAYRGNYTDRPGNGIAIEDGALVARDPPTLRYEEVSYAADLKWEWEGLVVQSEFITRDIRYTDATRPRATVLPSSPPGFQPDARDRGVYLLVGYRTPWLNLMPFAMLQYVDRISDAHEYSVGLNLRPSPRVALKAEYKYILIEDPPGLDLGDLDFLGLQLAWSF
jgi:hypothetical protein